MVLSGLLCQRLDAIGYDSDMIRYRREAYAHFGEELDVNHCVVVGSKGEGLTSVFESDIDVMFVMPAILCVENDVENLEPPSCSAPSFTIDTAGCYPGYCRLVPVPGSCLEDELSSMLRFPGILKHTIIDHIIEDQEDNVLNMFPFCKGPAMSMSDGLFDFDMVIALRCLCPGILRQWAKRERHYAWPNEETKTNVLHTEARLVLASSNTGNAEELRICFTSAELILLQSLNEIQIKLYILLKMILKKIICPRRKELNSYIMKNLVFWMAEMYPPSIFQKKNLCRCLMKALKMLSHSIAIDSLPYYMIPERNILGELKMADELKARLLTRIGSLIETGPSFLYMCDKLRTTLNLAPDILGEYKNVRDEVERRFLTCTILPNADRENINEEFAMSILDLVFPDWRDKVQIDSDNLLKIFAYTLLR